jgi:RNase adaptor protein for sRNA GlmZ degradation
MDDRLHGLDTSTPQTADAMLDWIARSRSSVVAVSVHREGLKEIASLKCTSSHEGIDQIRFVYLFCEKDALEKRLRQHGSGRKPDNIEGTLADYDEMDRILREVMDESIDTTQLSMLDVAAKVRMLLCADGAASDGAGE